MDSLIASLVKVSVMVFAALVAIDPVVIFRGKVPSDLWPQVQAWAIANRAALVAEWNKCNPLYPTV